MIIVLTDTLIKHLDWEQVKGTMNFVMHSLGTYNSFKDCKAGTEGSVIEETPCVFKHVGNRRLLKQLLRELEHDAEDEILIMSRSRGTLENIKRKLSNSSINPYEIERVSLYYPDFEADTLVYSVYDSFCEEFYETTFL